MYYFEDAKWWKSLSSYASWADTGSADMHARVTLRIGVWDTQTWSKRGNKEQKLARPGKVKIVQAHIVFAHVRYWDVGDYYDSPWAAQNEFLPPVGLVENLPEEVQISDHIVTALSSPADLLLFPSLDEDPVNLPPWWKRLLDEAGDSGVWGQVALSVLPQGEISEAQQRSMAMGSAALERALGALPAPVAPNPVTGLPDEPEALEPAQDGGSDEEDVADEDADWDEGWTWEEAALSPWTLPRLQQFPDFAPIVTGMAEAFFGARQTGNRGVA
jgi:hypothetical protein